MFIVIIMTPTTDIIISRSLVLRASDDDTHWQLTLPSAPCIK
jgi:hypothetical protein